MGKSSMDEGISTAVSGYRRVTVFLATLQRHLEFEQSIYFISPFMGVCVCDTGLYRKIAFFFTGYMMIMLWDYG